MSHLTYSPAAMRRKESAAMRAIARRACAPVARSEWSLFLPVFAGALVFILALGVI